MWTPWREGVKGLLQGRSAREVHELCIKALRTWYARAKGPARAEFQMHGTLGVNLLPLLAHPQQLNWDGQTNLWKEVFLDQESLDSDWMAPVVEFTTWLTLAGLAFPHGRAYPVGDRPTQSGPWATSYRLTQAGHRLFGGTEEHPLVPDFSARLKARCQGMPDGIAILFEDARACMERVLNRPAIVLLGVAYEVATKEVCKALLASGHLTVVSDGAKRRINDLRGVVNNVIPNGPQAQDDRDAAQRALDFADDLRRRRNDAAHTAPRYGFDDREEIEDLFASAGRKLPDLWLLHR